MTDPFGGQEVGWFNTAVAWVAAHPKTVVAIALVLAVLWIL